MVQSHLWNWNMACGWRMRSVLKLSRSGQDLRADLEGNESQQLRNLRLMDKHLSTAVGWAIIAIPIALVFAAGIISDSLRTGIPILRAEIEKLVSAVERFQFSITQADDLLNPLSERLYDIEQAI